MHRDLSKTPMSPYHKWLGKLATYQGEIKNYQSALAEVVSIHQDREIISLAKKFRSDFTRKLQEIEQHLHALKTQSKTVYSARQISHLERFSRTYSSLKNCYQVFLSDIQNR